jgi:hypothetical protein
MAIVPLAQTNAMHLWVVVSIIAEKGLDAVVAIRYLLSNPQLLSNLPL